MSVLEKHNLKIQFDKCKFFSKETEYLGHILTPEGVKPNPKKIQDILKLKLPETQKQIKSFLGITGYYRKFIKDYAKVAQPMTHYLRKNTKVDIKDIKYINAFEKLKKLITEDPILKYPDFNKNFVLITDASAYAIGAVLQQSGHPICYASRTLNNHERNYSTIEKELLAIVWSTNYFRPYLYGKKFDILTDHQPLKWLHAKSNNKDINPRLNRWLLKLGEYEMNVDYIKGKENKIADFLSRINTDTHEINLNQEDNASRISEDIEGSLYNNVDNEDLDTVHSQEEDLHNHFPILESVVNRFKTQIILTNNKEEEIKFVFKNRKIYINEDDINNNLADILRRYIKKGRIGIFTELNDNLYNIVQQKLIELYNNDRNIKIYRCSFHAKDIINENEQIKQVHNYHKYETGHTGINETYESLKKLIYFPSLKKIIEKYINNCDICNRSKYDRKPIKEKFKLTETPKDIKEILSMDIYTNCGNHFLTFIDRFSKLATAFYLEDRNNQTIIEKLRELISLRGKFNKLITDNEFKSLNIRDFLRNENIEHHLTKSNNHTGNADIERFHNTLNEKIRIIGIENKNLNMKEKVAKAIEFYNNSIHSTTKEKPINIQEGKCDKLQIYNNMLANKDKMINNRNANREDYVETRSQGYIKNYKNVRHKDKPKFKKSKLNNIHSNNIKRPLKFADNCNDNSDSNSNTNDTRTVTS